MNIWSRMAHPADGEWRAYLDGEVSEDRHIALERHLRQCIRCRTRLTDIQETAGFAAARLGALRAVADIAPVPPMPTGPRRIETSQPARKEGVPMTRSRFTSRVAAVAVAAILAVSLLFPGVRSAAAGFLTVFRVQEAKVIQINPADFQEPGIMPSMLEELLQYELVQTGEQLMNLTAQEMAALGFQPPAWLPAGYTPTAGSFLGESTHVLTMDVDRVNEVLRLLGSKELLPSEMRGQTLTMSFGPIMVMGYHSDSGGFLNVQQSGAPAYSATGGVDASRILSVITSAQVPDSVRSQLQGVDLTSTMPLPAIDGQSQEVAINGQAGVYTHWDGGGGIMWVEDGQLRSVSSLIGGNLSLDDLRRIAESLGR